MNQPIYNELMEGFDILHAFKNAAELRALHNSEDCKNTYLCEVPDRFNAYYGGNMYEKFIYIIMFNALFEKMKRYLKKDVCSSCGEYMYYDFENRNLVLETGEVCKDEDDLQEEWHENYFTDLYWGDTTIFSSYLRLWNSEYSSRACIIPENVERLANLIAPDQDIMEIDEMPAHILCALTIDEKIVGRWVRTGKLSPSELLLHNGYQKSGQVEYGNVPELDVEGTRQVYDELLRGLEEIYSAYSSIVTCGPRIEGFFFPYALMAMRRIPLSEEFTYSQLTVCASPLLYVYRVFRRSSYGRTCRRHDAELFREIDRAYSFFLNPSFSADGDSQIATCFCDGNYLGRMIWMGYEYTESEYYDYGGSEGYISDANISRGFPLAHKLMDMGILYLNSKYHFLGDITEKMVHRRNSDKDSVKNVA